MHSGTDTVHYKRRAVSAIYSKANSSPVQAVYSYSRTLDTVIRKRKLIPQRPWSVLRLCYLPFWSHRFWRFSCWTKRRRSSQRLARDRGALTPLPGSREDEGRPPETKQEKLEVSRDEWRILGGIYPDWAPQVRYSFRFCQLFFDYTCRS